VTTPTIDPAVLAAAYAAQNRATRATVQTYLAALWAQLTSWRSDDAARFAGQAAAVVTGAQQRTAALTTAYLGQAITAAGGTPPAATATAVSDEVIRGVAASEVYTRPFKTIWWGLSQGKDLQQCVKEGGDRLQDMAATDIQLAKTHTSRRMTSGATGIGGYRRVLEGTYSCALCVIASTQRYHQGALMPIHGGCDCGVAPIGSDRDPGQVIDEVSLNQMHDIIARDLGEKYVDRGARSPLDYRTVLIEHNHSELGPILAVNGQAFTGPGDLH
jgi:hypothetical protein